MLCVRWCGFVFLALSSLEMRHVASSVCIEYVPCPFSASIRERYASCCQHWMCDMLCAVSALEVRYTMWYISIEVAIYCVLYQHCRCDILCVVSALELRYEVSSIIKGC
jgi:hypothetical protein